MENKVSEGKIHEMERTSVLICLSVTDFKSGVIKEKYITPILKLEGSTALSSVLIALLGEESNSNRKF